MGGITVQVVGLEKVMQQIAGLGPRIAVAVEQAVEEETNREFELTQEQVPVRTGALKASGRVEPATESEAVVSAIAYGDEQVDYALQVHEDLTAYHPHGKAKYVEDPVREEMTSGRALARMKKDINAVLGTK